MQNIYDQTGNLLSSLRHKRGLSFAALAKATGITTASLSRYESGLQHIPMHVLCKLLAYYKQRVEFKPKGRNIVLFIVSENHIPDDRSADSHHQPAG